MRSIAITAAAFQEIGRRARNGGTNEHEIQQWFMEAFARENLVTDDLPVVAVNANSGNPHYAPQRRKLKTNSRGRFRAARHLGQEKYAGSRVLRHHLDRLCGQDSLRSHARNLQDRPPGARRRSKDSAEAL